MKPDLDQIVSPSSFRCACGCDLRLSRRDHAAAARCLAIAGPERHTVNLRSSSGAGARERLFAPDPTLAEVCPRCHAEEVPLATWIVEYIERWGVRWPHCATCREEG